MSKPHVQLDKPDDRADVPAIDLRTTRPTPPEAPAHRQPNAQENGPDGDGPDGDEPDGDEPGPAQKRGKGLRWALMAGGLLAVIIGGAFYWLSGGRWEDTNDAYIQADSMILSTDVSGIVATIPVREGEAVTKGQILFSLDPRKFQIALNNARANLAQVRLNVEAMKVGYQAALRGTDAKQPQIKADQATYNRYVSLVKQHAVTQQATDDARFKLAADQQAVIAMQSQARAQLTKLGGNPHVAVEDTPAFTKAQALVAEATREMNHSVVRAPYNGIVTQVNKLQIGMYLGVGTAALALVSTDHMWVQAQPKETQLTYVRAGDHVDVSFARYPGRTWNGTVQSVAPATDQNFSLLPAENSSGNWVDVVQRIPVRVTVDTRPRDPPLSAGMSAEIDIDTKHVRTFSDLF